MGPFLVVVTAIVLDEDASFGHAEHEFPVEAFVTQRAIEALDMAILLRAARIDVEALDPALGQPLLQDSGNELRSIVTADVLGQAAFGGQPFHDFNQIMSRQSAGHMQGQTFPAVFVD